MTTIKFNAAEIEIIKQLDRNGAAIRASEQRTLGGATCSFRTFGKLVAAGFIESMNLKGSLADLWSVTLAGRVYARNH